MTIRKLEISDYLDYKSIRLEALKDNPYNFISTFAEESEFENNKWQEIVATNNLFGYFTEENVIVATVGLLDEKKAKLAHLRTVFAMYVKPTFRGLGISMQLMNHLKSIVPKDVGQFHLGCIANNLPAINFYRKCGFRVYGTRPNYIRIDNEFYDEVIMICEL
jgi:ribosomal protein S18 acetylase RimI-like enzyme